MQTKHRAFKAGEAGRFGAQGVKGLALVERLGISYDNRSLPSGTAEAPLRDNKLGITKKHLLDQAEAVLSPITIPRALKRLAHQEKLGLKELRIAHREILGQLYPWAGQLRQKDIAKETPFAPVARIVPMVERAFSSFHQRHAVAGDIVKGLQALSPDGLGNALAQLYSDLNAAHPFPEGNGRSNRTMVTAYARKAGSDLDWTRIADEKLAFDRASELSKNGGSIEPLAALFRRTVVPLDIPAAGLAPQQEVRTGTGHVKRTLQRLAATI